MTELITIPMWTFSLAIAVATFIGGVVGMFAILNQLRNK